MAWVPRGKAYHFASHNPEDFPMSADRHRGIRREKQKRAKQSKKQARLQHGAAAAAQPAAAAPAAAAKG